MIPSGPAAAQPSNDGTSETIATLSADLDAATSGVLTVAIDPETELVSLVGATGGNALTDPSDAAPDQVAAEFVGEYGPLFGVAGDELTVDRVTEGLDGTSAVRMQQVVDGVPVLAGEIAIQVDGDGRVLSASGESSPDVDVDTAPMFGAAESVDTAIAVTAKYDATDPALLAASDPELWIYDPQLIGAADVSAPRLVWRTEVTSAQRDVERLVLVDAHDGSIALDVSTREDAGPARQVCDNANSTSLAQQCTSPVRVEGDPPNLLADVDSAYDLAGVTYNFYKNVLGRDGIDGHDLPIISTVRYCPSSAQCPYANAFWNGDQMVYGAGYAKADDVVAHELTHGVTEHTSNLFYYGESGAINESMSDIFGELIDQSDLTSGADPVGDKWLVGEQLPGSALRNMANPPAKGDPDRMTSPFYSGLKKDFHEVHTNSGVGNKAAFLITDGGIFNGQTIAGLGIIKTAQIYYRAQTTLLGPGSDYLDLYWALQQACSNLVGGGGGITSIDCQQVTKAVTATEMNLAPTATGARLTAPVCNAGTIIGETLFSDDMESGTDNWGTAASDPAAAWVWYAGSSQSGTHSLHGPDVEVGTGANRSMSSTLRLKVPLTVPIGTSYLRFDHSFHLESNANSTQWYDGGVVEYSTAGVAGPWVDAGSLVVNNGYTGTLPANNVLGTRPAFTGTSAGYQTTRIDLSSLAGRSNVMFRFRIGTDEMAGADGWFIDDVSVYRCGAVSPPTAPQSATVSFANGSATLVWTPPASTGFPMLTNYIVTPYADGIAQPPITVNGPGTTYTTGPLAPGVSYTFTVAAQNAAGTGPPATAKYFTAIGPARLVDTRPGESPTALRPVAKTKIGGSTVLQVQVDNLAGLTPSSGIAAVSLNVTAAGATVPGYVTVYPCGPLSLVSTVNFAAHDTVPNATIAPVSAGGAICLFANTPVDVIVDINGWFAASGGYTPVGPGRVLDTRPGESPGAVRQVAKTKVGGAKVLEVQVSNLAGLTPISGVNAVSLNVTATASTLPGFVTVYPCGSLPAVSNLNFAAGDTVANATITPVSSTGTICIFANTDVDVIVDINGWFSTIPGFAPTGPVRVLDTRPGQSPTAIRAVTKSQIGGATVLQVQVSNLPGYTPATAIDAVSLNVTATGSQVPGFVTVSPCGALSQVSNLNFAAGATVANAVITPVSATGTICFFANTAVDVIVDINGWFAA